MPRFRPGPRLEGVTEAYKEAPTVRGQREEAAAPASATTRLSARRRIAVWTLVVLGSLIALVSILTLWVDRQMLDNDSWRRASEDLIADPAIRNALSVYAVNQLYDHVDVAAALKARLPANLQQLADPLAGVLRDRTTNRMNVLLSRPRVQQLFVNASTVAHEKLVNVLEDKTGFGISTGNGVVTLNLRELVEEVGADVGIPASVLDKLPQDTGVVTVMKSSQLGAVQKGVKLIKALSVWLLFAVLGLYALAIYLARGMRRETLRNVGCAFVIVGLLVLVVRRFVGNYAVDTLSSPTFSGPVRDVWLIGSSILGQIGRATVLYGAVGLAGAVLAGPGALANRARRWLAPTLNDRQGVVWGVTSALYLLLVLWGPTHALRVWWGILLLAALLAIGIVALRRQTLREFPPTAPGEAVGGPSSPARELAKLSQLRASGEISSDEYERAKTLVLS
jgi:hypothetical protein